MGLIMNFLQLCQKTQQYSGIQGFIASTTNLVPGSQEALLVETVRSAWVEIQNFRKDFKFLRDEVTLGLLVSQQEYSEEDIFGTTGKVSSWKTDRFLYKSSPLRYIPYDRWVLRSSQDTPAEPGVFTIRPGTTNLIFNAVDTEYDVVLQYYKTPQILSVNNDVPLLPVQFHYLIIFGAVLETASFLGDLITYQRFATKYSQLLGQLLRSEVPSRRVNITPFA